jgi:MFS family permease
MSSCQRGYLVQLTNNSLPTQQYRCYFNQGPRGPPFGPEGESCSGPEASVQGGITAAMPGGSFLGALVSGYLTDKLGRRRAIQIGCAIWIIGSIISCAAQNIGMLIAGRLINGFAVGICSAQVPVYVSELAPPSKRGRVVGSQQCAALPPSFIWITS